MKKFTLTAPFKALHPKDSYLSQMIAPPYDVVTTEEAQQFAAKKPYNFFHLSKAEIDCLDCPEGEANQKIYQKAAENFQKFKQDQVWISETLPAYYLYELRRGAHRQLGILAPIHTDAYKKGRIRQHELTRKNKLADRIQLTQALQAQISPVLLTHRPLPALQQLLHHLIEIHSPLYHITDAFQVEQTVWQINEKEFVQKITEFLESIQNYYIADGHHRAAAAATIAEQYPETETLTWHNSFLAGIFASNELDILPYQRLIKKIPHSSVEALMADLSARFPIKPIDAPSIPTTPDVARLYIQNQWYECQLQPTAFKPTHPLEHLPTQILHKNLIEPIFKIMDPRQDPNIDFIGGLNTLKEIEARVNQGQYELGIIVAATTMDQLFEIADHELILPPKSTWFEPKLTDGFVMYS